MNYRDNKMCFLCLNTKKTSLITYKDVESNSNDENKCLKILLNCYPELNMLKLDFSIYVCHKCDRKLKSYYNFKINGITNFKRYLSYIQQSFKEENKENVMEYTNLNVQIIDSNPSSLIISNKQNCGNVLDNLAIKEENPVSEDADEIINLNEIGNNEAMTTQITQDEMEYYEVNETKTELSIVHEINDNINYQLNECIHKNDNEFISNVFSKSELNENEIATCENNENKDILISNQQQLINIINSNINGENDFDNSQQQCSETSKTESELENHLKIHCKNTLFKCHICLVTYNTEKTLKAHLNIHSEDDSRINTEVKRYNCSVCLKGYNYKSQLVVHSRIHTGDKPYSCFVCSKRFTQKSNLGLHFRIHATKKPYSCSVCSKSFNQKSSLQYHFQIHTGVKLFSCSVCPKQFKNKHYLKIHTQQKHSDIYNYCSV